MSVLVPEHPCRIYRTYGERKHDLSLMLRELDIYGEDVWARMTADVEQIILQPEMSTDAPVTLYFEPNVDIEAGYVIELKKTMLYGGRRVVVETQLSETASAGSMVLTVARAWGFSNGDIILLSDQNGRYERTKVHRVDTSNKTLTLYADLALENTWPAGSAVRASQWLEAASTRRTDRYILAICQRVPPRSL